MSIPISTGSGTASVAAEAVGGLQYQQIELYGQGGSSVLAINPDGSLKVSILGTPTFNVIGNASVSGTVGASIVGVVPVQLSNSSVITVWQNSSVIAVPTGNQSVSGTVGASVIGIVPVQLSNSSVIAVVQGSIATVIIGGSIAATFVGTPNQSVSGTVGASIIGVVPVQTSNTSIIAVIQSSSVLSVPVGSTLTVWQSPSIVGTYSEDATSSSSDRGLFVLGARNDTLSSVTSNDLDYSGIAIGPVGEVIVAAAPITKWVQGTGSMLGGLPLTGSSVAVIGPGGASVFTYITGVQVVNMGATTQWLKFEGATNSTIGFTIAPAGGGSNIIYSTPLKTSANGAFTASISGAGSGASVYVTAQGFISKT